MKLLFTLAVACVAFTLTLAAKPALPEQGVKITVKSDRVNCYETPSSKKGVKETFSKGQVIESACFEIGQKIEGNKNWHKIGDSKKWCFVADDEVDTNGQPVPKCHNPKKFLNH